MPPEGLRRASRMMFCVNRSRHLTDAVGVLARVSLGAVMLIAGALKLPDPSENVRAVRAYEALPETVVPFVGHVLPVLEVAVGLLLIFGLLTRGAAIATGALQIVFIAGISWAWANGLEIDCGCFGGGGEKEGASAAYPFDIARDVGFIALAGLAWRWPARRFGLDRFVLGLPGNGELAHGHMRRDAIATDASSTNRGDTL